MPEEGTPFLRDRPRRVRPGALVVAAASLALLSTRAARRPAAARAARAAALWADDGGVLGDWRAGDDDAANATSRRAGKDRDNCKVFKRTLALLLTHQVRYSTQLHLCRQLLLVQLSRDPFFP